MSGTLKIVRGRIREALGSLTGSKQAKTRGKAEQSIGKIEKGAKEGVDDVRDSAKENIAEAKEQAEHIVDKAQKANG